MTHLIFQTIVITAGCYLFYRQVIRPIMSSVRNDKKFQKKLDLLKSEVRHNFEFLSSRSFSKTFDKENDYAIYLEYEHISRKRKIRIAQKKHQRISCIIMDKGFFPVSLDTILKDLNIENNLRQHNENTFQYYTNQVKTASNILKRELEKITHYKSFRSFSHYDKILKNIRDNKYILEEVKDIIGLEDVPYFTTLNKHYCELCLKESDIKYAEIALILSAIRPINGYLDLRRPLMIIYYSILEIGEDPNQYFQTYALKEYNFHNKEIFQSLADKKKDKESLESMEFRIIKEPEVKIVYQFPNKMSNYDNWYY